MILSKINTEKLISYIKSECDKNDVKLSIKKGKYVKVNNLKTSGYFESTKQELVCAKQNPNFLIVLAHEFCHMTQWIDSKCGKCNIWLKYEKSNLSIFDEWLLDKSKNYRKNTLKAALFKSLNLELDNERRTHKLLKSFGMNQKELDLYVQKSNAYVLFYLYILETRRWYKPGNAPYENKAVVSSMSKKFNMNYKSLSNRIRKVYIEQNI
jgi:hypothetical protein